MNFIYWNTIKRTNDIYYDFTPYEPFEDEDIDEDGIFENSDIYVNAYDIESEMLANYNFSGKEFLETFGERVTQALKDEIKKGKNDGYIRDILSWDNTVINIDDVEEVNTRAKDVFNEAYAYYKDFRGYLLTDGTLLEFGESMDHISIENIADGMTIGKFVSLGNIRLGHATINLERRPTRKQYDVLDRMIGQYKNDTVYVDFSKYSEGRKYGTCIMGICYDYPVAEFVKRDIEEYFTNGTIPKGACVGESRKSVLYALNSVLNESAGSITCINESVLINRLFKGCNTLDDYKARAKKLILMGVVSASVLLGSIGYIVSLNDAEKKELQQEVVMTQKESPDTVKKIEDDTVYAKDFKASEAGINHIKSFEKLMLEPYYATPYEKKKGILTIGYGHKIKDDEKDKYKIGKRITVDEAERLFSDDLKEAEGYVKSLIMYGNVQKGLKDAKIYPQGLMDAMISMMFSGYGNFKNSLFYKSLCNCRKDAETGKINKNDYNCTVLAIKSSIIKQGGKTSNGLVNRRKAEYDMAK